MTERATVKRYTANEIANAYASNELADGMRLTVSDDDYAVLERQCERLRDELKSMKDDSLLAVDRSYMTELHALASRLKDRLQAANLNCEQADHQLAQLRERLDVLERALYLIEGEDNPIEDAEELRRIAHTAYMHNRIIELGLDS